MVWARGAWIDVGFPHFVKLERKPEYGLELQDVACGSSGLMLRIKLVKSSKESQREITSTTQNHGAKVLVNICAP